MNERPMGKFLLLIVGAIVFMLICLIFGVLCETAKADESVVKGTSAGFVTESPVDDPTGTASPMDDYIAGVKDTAPAGATKVVEIGWWCSIAQGEANFEVGIYSHDSGDDEPDELLAGVSRTNAKGETSGWKKVTGLDISITAETIYWIAVQLDNVASPDPKIDYSSDAGERYAYQGSRTTLTSPYDGAVGDDAIFAVYAVYETEEPPEEAPLMRRRKMIDNLFQGEIENEENPFIFGSSGLAGWTELELRDSQ